MKDVRAIVVGLFRVQWSSFRPRHNRLTLLMRLSSFASSSTDLPLWPLAREVAIMLFAAIIVLGSGRVSIFSGQSHWMWPGRLHMKHQPSCRCVGFGSSSGGSDVRIVSGVMISVVGVGHSLAVATTAETSAVRMAWHLRVEVFHVSHVSGPL